ncbi:MAG TPA: HEAT repeat domain-containing protein [Kofleriaceae bacterium]|nr:HEAT repeat domain-containing protein [Kofleriaceae bacterium]
MSTPGAMDAAIEEARRRALADPRSDEALIRLALQDDDDDDDTEVWDAIGLLHLRGSDAIWQRAAAMTRSEQPLERRRGFDILAQLGVPERQYPEETLALILDALEHEQDAAVLSSAAVAVTHRSDERAAAPLARHRNHPDAVVRHGVVLGLLTMETPTAIEALLELSRDSDVDVRDWATFALGSQIDVDTPQIRDALRNRLSDPDDETRYEALCGLARRKDASIVPLLSNEIACGNCSRSLLEAAQQLAHPGLLPALIQLRDRQDSGSCDASDWRALENAIAACESVHPDDGQNV